jgi:hypothetical protein
VLVLTDDRDRVIDPARSDEIFSAVHDAELVTIQSAGHAVILERPEEINEAIAGLAAKALARQAERQERTRQRHHVHRRDTRQPVTSRHTHDNKGRRPPRRGLTAVQGD